MSTTIWERVYTALAGINLPKAASVQQFASGALPDTFLVYKLVSGVPGQFADNEIQSWSDRIQISYFSRNGLLAMPDIQAAMIAAGFSPVSKLELPFNQTTGHYGLALEFSFLEEEL